MFILDWERRDLASKLDLMNLCGSPTIKNLLLQLSESGDHIQMPSAKS